MSEKPKVLYVDDEPINLMLFKVNFKKKYDVLTAEDGLKGLKILDEHNEIKVVISDMRMPYMCGLEFVEKAREKFPEKKYYLLTGYDITDEIQDAINNGLILKCFQKPFNIHEITNAIEESLGN